MRRRFQIPPPIALLGAIVAFGAGAAPAQQYHLRHYTADDGLPSSQVRDVTQDVHGRMWFATRAGIAAYDGRAWQTYNLAEGLSWANQFALCWDRDGGLWSVSSIAPFKIFHLEGERWQEVAGPASVSPETRITAFAVLGSGTTVRLVIATASDGVLLGVRGHDSAVGGSRPEATRWRRFGREDGLPDNRVTALAADGDWLIVATAGGLAELRDGALSTALAAVVSAPGRAIAGLAVERSGSPGQPAEVQWLLGEDWIGQLGGGRFVLLAESLPISHPSRPARLIAEPDRQGGIYFAHSQGVFYFHPELGLEVLGRDNGLLADGASSLHLDREDNLWVAGQRGATKIITRRLVKYSRRQGLFEDEVTAAFERRAGGIVLGHRGGVSLLGAGAVATLGLEKSAAERPGEPYRLPERVRDFAQDGAGVLWIAADSLGLARVTGLPIGASATAVAPTVTWYGAADGLRGAVTSVLFDSQDRLWAATDQGLFRRRGRVFENPVPAAPRLHVRRLFEGEPGELLAATSAGLYRLAEGVWSGWTCAGEAGCNSVFAVLPRAAGGLWVGTAAGLYRTDGDALVEASAAGPMIDRPIFFMVRDRRQRIWLGTDNGVLRWDGARLESFTVKDGLAGRETHRAAGLVDSRGDVWIGTERGVTVYSERLPGPRRAPPVVEITRVEVSGSPLPPSSTLDLGYDDNDLTFHFQAISLLDEDRIQISRRLEGLEPGWQPLESRLDRQLRYADLPPGDYRLHLKAANAEGLWSEVVSSAAISIARPYWQRPWFFLVVASLLASVLYTGQRHLAQQRYSRRLEIEVAERVAELHASEERYRHIFERSQAVKLLVDANSLKIIDANRAACRFYGHSLPDLKRLSLEDLRVRGGPQPGALRSESGTHLLAEQHRLASGEIRHVELYTSATEIQSRGILYVIVQDVTERRLAEQNMSTEKERLAATLRNIDDGVITTDARGEILLLNRKAEELTGWLGSLAVGKPLAEILRLHEVREDGDLGERLQLTISGQGSVQTGSVQTGSVQTGSVQTGTRDAFQPGGRPAQLASGVWRVLPREVAEAAPDRRRPRPASSPALRRLVFRPMAGGAGEGRTRSEVFEPIEEAILVARTGEHRLVELSGSPIRQGGEVSGLVLAFRDITERRKIESELAKTQKLEALGLLAGGIAHDFNNLLTVLLGNLSLLSRSPRLGDKQVKNLEDAETAVLRARDLTQQLLTFSRGGTPVRKAASIAEVISESASFVLSGSKVRCDIELPEDLWVVEIDAGQISQVLNNLLINAIQAMPEGGTVRIRGENLADPPGELPAGRLVAIHVIDQGVGIPREYLERIFDPYFSTKDKGRGLGLASAYSIAKQHDGLLTVASQPGRGTVFSLYLPASGSQALARPVDPAAVADRGGRVLIMDDDEGVRGVTGRMAEQLGYRVEYAAHGAEAIARYRAALERGEPFDAVIMDLTIPGAMGGQVAIRHLLDLDPEVRAIVASGYSNDPVLANYREYGFRGRISKPFETDDLARALNKVLARAGAVG